LEEQQYLLLLLHKSRALGPTNPLRKRLGGAWKSPGRALPPLDQKQCTNCGEMGHQWRNCKKLRGREPSLIAKAE